MNELPKEVQAGDEIEVQLAPLGDYPCRDGEPGHDLIQRVTPEAVSRLAHSFSHEILVDLDHASETSPVTAAANADKCAPAALKNAYLRDPALAAKIVKNIKAAPRAPEQKLLNASSAGLTKDSARALAAKLEDTLPDEVEEQAKALFKKMGAEMP